ncbi:hypothetical protein [Metabacillus fastidiosus]|uniref:hypothetical protein n=1 Tax=Metabacillus fastidiosus TaxID=1458 RepID=UPI0008263349|nr:hypothetical protein [Metabacillus fastidiosus]
MENLINLEILRDKFSKDEDSILVNVNLNNNQKCIIRCNFKIIHEIYGALEHMTVAHSPVIIGKKRKELILQTVKEQLYKEEYMAPRETEKGFYFGEHNWYDLDVKNAKVCFIRKFNSSDVELLAERTYSEYKNGEKIKETYYYKDQNVYVTTESYFWHDNLVNALVNQPLPEAITKILSDNIVIDQNNKTYFYQEVNDANNIRILPSGIIRDQSFTFYEWLEHKDEENVVVSLPHHLVSTNNFHDNEVLIHSNRILGEPVTTFVTNEWIRSIELNRYGRVVDQSGISVTVIWEDQYNADFNQRHYKDLIKVDNPITLIDRPKLIKFHVLDTENWVGYGWEIETGINSKKVELIGSLNEKRLDPYIKYKFSEGRWMDDNKIKKRLMDIHGLIPNYLICHASQVSELTKMEQKAVELLLINQTPYHSMALLKNLFKMADTNEANYDFYLVQSLMLQQTYKSLSLFEKLTDAMVKYGTSMQLINWFQYQVNSLKSPMEE